MDAVIVDFCRSPFTPARKGALAGVRPDELAAQVVAALVRRNQLDPALIEDIIVGCAFPEGEQGLNLGRMVGLLARLPLEISGVTVNRFCGSSMQAVHMAAGAIALGAGEAFICAGVESMSRVPLGGFNPLPHPGLAEDMPAAFMDMGETAENLVERYKISRGRQEAFALESQEKVRKAVSAGLFAEEIIPINTANGIVQVDGCPHPRATAEELAALPPAFRQGGTITAATSSPLTDGAAALLVTSRQFAKRHGLKVLAKIRAVAVRGCRPEIMGIGPVGAVKKVLERSGLNLDDMDIVEINEAFAAQVLAVLQELKIDPARVNLHGGAVALGHPLGASGARITGKAAQLLAARGAAYALATMCIGGGQGIATILEADHE